MQNLHLKNLQNIDQIDIYLNYLNKIQTTCNNEYKYKKRFITLKKLYKYIQKELESINIKNEQIELYKDYLIEYISDIIKYDFKNTEERTFSIMFYPLVINMFKNYIEKLKLLKDIDINSQWINLDYEYKHHNYIDKEKVLTISYMENHLTSSHKKLNIFIDYNNIIKKITINDY
jgi:hypothetical protein